MRHDCHAMLTLKLFPFFSSRVCVCLQAQNIHQKFIHKMKLCYVCRVLGFTSYLTAQRYRVMFTNKFTHEIKHRIFGYGAARPGL